MNQRLTYETLFYDDPEIGPGVASQRQGGTMKTQTKPKPKNHVIRDIDHIFWDMDGVFADFVGGVLDLMGVETRSAGTKWPPGEYAIETVFGITTERLWNLINRGGVDWWSHLDRFEWHTELRSIIADCRGSHSVLTSPGDCPAAYQGKRIWADRHLHGLPLHLTSHKQLLAKPSALLIDDSDKNCEQFVAAGGRAILFPQLWNSNHAETGNRIEYVRELLIDFKVL